MPSVPLLGRPSHYSYLKELHAKNFCSDVSQRPWITNNTMAHHISELSQPRVLWDILLAYPSVHTSIFSDRRIVKLTLYLAPTHLSKQCSLQHQLHSSTSNLHMVAAASSFSVSTPITNSLGIWSFTYIVQFVLLCFSLSLPPIPYTIKQNVIKHSWRKAYLMVSFFLHSRCMSRDCALLHSRGTVVHWSATVQ